MTTAAEKRYMGRIASLPCIACGAIGVHVHHCFTHMGGGKDNMKVIPLCPYHHQLGGYGNALHAGKKAWEKRYGTEAELIERVKDMLNKQNLGLPCDSL